MSTIQILEFSNSASSFSFMFSQNIEYRTDIKSGPAQFRFDKDNFHLVLLAAFGMSRGPWPKQITIETCFSV